MDTTTVVSSLAALAQETRLTIFRSLVEAGPTGMSVSEIGAPLRAAPATLSFHLKELTHAGLIMARQDGRFIFYSANYDRMSALIGFLTDKCCVRDDPDCQTSCAGRKPKAQSKRTKELS